MQQKLPPVWLMGLTNATFGMCGGFAVVAVPQMLSAQGIPGGHIAALVAWILSPTAWAFPFAPMLDVRFSRRTYALFFSVITAACMGLTAAYHSRVGVVVALMMTAYIAATLVQGAVGGWMGSLIAAEDDSKLGAWFAIGNTGAGGVMMLSGGEIIAHVSPVLAGCVIAAMMMTPSLIYLLVPAPGPDRMLAKDSFAQFFGEVFAMLKRPHVRLMLVLFLMPSASFALTNVLAGIGGDFHASERLIGICAGVGSTIAAIAGSLIVPVLARRIKLLYLYLAIGIFGGLFTMALLLLPREPWAFAIAITAENLMQAASFAAGNGLMFESIGQENPLAATQFTVLTSAMCVPITYMGFVDGKAYDMHGVIGTFLADAAISIAVCMLLALGLMYLQRRGALPGMQAEP